jgi:hypothetical protein
MFQPIGGGDESGKIPVNPAVHGDRIPKVGMGIKKCRADPYPGCPDILFDRGDNPVFNNNVHWLESEFFTDECMSGQFKRGVFHTP